MAVGSHVLPPLYEVKGVLIGTASAGIKTVGRNDLVVFALEEGCKVAGVYTKNAFCAAPVTLTKKHIKEAQPRYFVINTGNANAGTGEAGMQAALAVCKALAEQTGVEENTVLPFSTGVIGEQLPVEKIQTAIPVVLENLDVNGWKAAASGIMTTDTRPKGISSKLKIDGVEVTITGIAKGSGMIRPDMATMLAYVATDANLEQEVLDQWLIEASDLSFNRITIDGDTSTNDCCMLVASGKSGVTIQAGSESGLKFKAALNQIFITLAQELIKDGEGATKFVSIQINGGVTKEESLKVAYAIAESPLVKTALFASDPNWGRILAVVGRAGLADLDISKIDIYLDEVCIVEHGGVADSYTEEAGAAVMAKDEIAIRVDLSRGECSETIWTSDLSYDYVKINAEYRT